MKAGTVLRALHGKIKHETAKALLFQLFNEDGTVLKECWFPLSQIGSIHRTYDEIDGTFDVIMASEWILGQNGVLSLAGAANVNPVTSVAITKPVFTGATKETKANRLPYKDDEAGSFDEYFDSLNKGEENG